MKPAREPASSRPKPCAYFKKSHESCPFAAPCGPRRKQNSRGQTSAFPSETSRFTPLIHAHRDSAPPWLVDDRAALRLRRIWYATPYRERPRSTRIIIVVAYPRPAFSAKKRTNYAPSSFDQHAQVSQGQT